MREILEGRPPSAAFAKYLEAHPGTDKYDVAEVFTDTFPDVDSVSHQVIWKWKRPGMDDGKLDLILLDLLQKAGYL